MAINRNILFGTTGKIDPRTGRVTGLPQQQPRQPVIGQAQAVQGVAQPAIPALPSVTQPQAPVTQPTTPQQFNAFGAPTGFTFGAPQQPPSPIPTAPPAPQQPDVMQGTLQGLEAQIRALQGQITGQQGEQAIRGREEDILRGIRISPEEQDIQQRLNALLSRTELGRVAVQEKPIAAPFITGQLASLQRQAGVQAAPFQRQLALEQGKRQAALGRAGVALDIEQARRQRERERTEETRPEFRTVDGQIVRISGGKAESIFGQPSAGAGVTLSPGQVRFERDPTTGELTQVATGGPRLPTETEIAKSLERTEKQETAKVAQGEMIGLIGRVLADPDLPTISGVSRLLISARTAATADVRGKINQLKALTSLEGRTKLKGSGTISDFEAQMLSDSATSINSAIQDDGRIKMTDEDVIRNLQNIRGSLLLKAGHSVSAIVTNPSTGESVQTELTSKEAQDLFLDGNLIDFQ